MPTALHPRRCLRQNMRPITHQIPRVAQASSIRCHERARHVDLALPHPFPKFVEAGKACGPCAQLPDGRGDRTVSGSTPKLHTVVGPPRQQVERPCRTVASASRMTGVAGSLATRTVSNDGMR